MTTNATINNDIAALLPRLRRFARTIVYNREDADDLVQIAVERALGRSAQWEPDTRLDSWIFRIMKNAWIDEVRSRIRRDNLFAPEEAGEHVGDQAAEAQQQRMAIEKAIGMLSEEHRMVVALVLVDGMPYKEASEVLEIPIGTLTSRLVRARAALQEILSDQKRTAT
ncbi:RNA polymerase sigma-70 factor (ECF subfamily) [Duganella sp. 1411]|jgi:RNA polymerase sigma-70 factor (ECF subfamily)|uniref:RNA polymerase sigma factor n=1 Tax=Duganella sp. 1411 TaxID=2806572 RepID=UPI001AE9CDBA|nr:RNA polymerase sigma factor [Duganella sp. 1411]MBP1206236.1 RNA polymerase sigma-70 factor (ECF subfamily) [Duganella sp. 1411]